MTVEGRIAIRNAKRIAWAVIAEVAEQLVETLDLAAGDADREPEEDFGADDVGENRTWIEAVDQRQHSATALSYAHFDDDAEEDDGGGECTDDEPGFDRQPRAIANIHGSCGPGCTISDPDFGVDDIGEREDA